MNFINNIDTSNFYNVIKCILNDGYNLTQDVRKIISLINNFYRLNIKSQIINKIDVV